MTIKGDMFEETLEALNDIQHGLIVDGDVVLEWLDSWGK